MKQWKTIGIVLLSVCALGLTALLVYAGVVQSRGETFRLPAGNRSKGAVEGEIAAAGAERIVLDFNHNSSDLVLYRGETDRLKVKESYSVYSSRDPYEQAELTERDGVVTVTGKGGRQRGNWFFFGDYGSYVQTEIYLPASFTGELEVRGRSGNIENRDALQLKTFACDMTSGNLELRDVQAGELDVDLTSGNVLYTGETLAGSVSATSGNIDLRADRLGGDLRIDVSSGEVELELSADAAFLLEGKASSGDIDTDWEEDIYYLDSDRRNRIRGEIGNDPVFKLEVSATSGDIDINRR